MFQTDCFFAMGNTHTVCQDYAITKKLGKNCIGVVSDGCSIVKDDSGHAVESYTDVGARVLSFAAIETIAERYDRSDIEHHIPVDSFLILERAKASCVQMGLPQRSLSATLLAVHSRNDAIITTVAGDGLVAARDRKTKDWYVFEHHFSGPPYYLRYEDNIDILQQFTRNCKGYTYISYTISPSGSMRYHEVFPSLGGSFCTTTSFLLDHYDAIAVASDGMFAFRRKNDNGLPELVDTSYVLSKFLDFRRRGVFMRRAYNKAMREFVSEGIYPTDDISMAVVEAL